MRGIIATHDEQARTAHDIAADTDDLTQLPGRVQWALQRRTRALHARQRIYRQWTEQIQEQVIYRQRSRDLHRSRDQGLDYGIEL